MLNKEDFFKLRWLMAKNEFKYPDTTGSFSFQRAKSNSIIDIHTRVSGIHLGLTASRSKHMLDWIKLLQLDLLSIDRWIINDNSHKLPNIGIRWTEYEKTAMADTVHCVYEFLQKHNDRKPIIFNGEFWYFGKIIENQIKTIDEIKKDSVLVISYPFMENLKVKDNMNQILKRCCELNVPVLLDCIWLPLTSELYFLEHTDCIEMITHSMTKTLPLAGIKGGFCFYKKPLPIEMRHNEIHGKIGAFIFDKLINEKGYWYVRDSHYELQKKWCSILGLEQHDVVIVGTYKNNHPLKEFGLKKNNPENLFSLVPFFNHDLSCTNFLIDKKLI